MRSHPKKKSVDCTSIKLELQMYSPEYYPRQRWNLPKDTERNFVAAFFHMATIALTCTSLAQLGWFRLRGGQCAPHLAVYQFFSLGYFNKITRPADTTALGVKSETPPMVIQYYSPNGCKLSKKNLMIIEHSVVCTDCYQDRNLTFKWFR